MLAALLAEPFRIELIDRAVPPLGVGQVLVRVEQCGVCTSELALWAGTAPESLPLAIGHEVAGTIEELGIGVEVLKVGDRVAAWMSEGGFAEQAVVGENVCVPVPPGVAYPALAEPVACAVNAVERVAPALADDVVIVGAGFMGNLIQLVTALKGPRTITVADLRADALRRARKLGAVRVVHHTGDESLTDVVREITDGRGADVVYEVTGTAAGLELAGQVTRASGKLCIVGYHQGGARQIPMADWNWKALQIINAHVRDVATIMQGMRVGLRLVHAGFVDPSSLVTDSYRLTEITEAFERAMAKPDGFVKAVIEAS